MSAAPSLASSLPVIYRELNPDSGTELNFVRSSFAKSSLANRPAKVWTDRATGKPTKVERCRERPHFQMMAEGSTSLVNRLLARSRTIVAIPTNTPSLVAGWIAFEVGAVGGVLGCLHFVYVSSTFRKQGLGRALLGRMPELVKTYSHWSEPFERLAPSEWEWRPDLLEKRK